MLTKGRLKKCYGVLLVVFTILWSLLNGYCNVLAVTKDYNRFLLRLRYVYGDSYVVTDPLLYNQEVNGVRYIDRVSLKVTEIGTPPINAEYLVVSGKVNLINDPKSVNSNHLAYVDGDPPNIWGVYLNDASKTFIRSSLNVYQTDWYIHTNAPARTFTYEFSFLVPASQFPNGSITSLDVTFEYPGKIVNPRCQLTGGPNEQCGGVFYFEPVTSNRLIADFTLDNESALLQQQIQLQQLSLDAINGLNNTIREHYEKEQESYDNIAGQSASDIQGATNAQTTSLIGVISNFISALSNVNTGSCQLTLPFPNYAGGSQTVNPCNGKQIAPTMVQVVSSLLLIVVFVPLAFIVLRMIYNEIRSWTNG